MIEAYRQYMEAWPWLHYVVALLIILIFLFLRKIFIRYVFAFILRVSRSRDSKFLPNFLLSWESPMRFLFVIIGFYVAIHYLDPPQEWMTPITNIFRSLIIVVVGWGLFNFSGTSSDLFKRFGKKLDRDEDSMLVPFFSKVIRALIVALTLMVIAVEWGYDVNGFIAGLGLGGLAFALAAQDTISNFFGGIIIVTERPFKKGDWVETPSVEGIIEDISFRSTKVRTFSESLVVVPNSTLAHEPITNWSEMTKRRVFFQVRVQYDTPVELVKSAAQRMEEELKESDEIHPDEIYVHFETISESGLDLMLYYFTNTTSWVEWLKVRERMNFRLLEILEEENVELALPSRDLYFKETGNLLPITEKKQ